MTRLALTLIAALIAAPGRPAPAQAPHALLRVDRDGATWAGTPLRLTLRSVRADGVDLPLPDAAPRPGPCATVPASRPPCAGAMIRDGRPVSEWWEQRADAYEHGVTVTGGAADEVEVEVAVVGARVSPDGMRLYGYDASWRYDQAVAWDATGERLAVHQSGRTDAVHLAVDTRGATFPVHIDPLLSLAETRPTSEAVTLGLGDVNGDGQDDAILKRFNRPHDGDLEVWSYDAGSGDMVRMDVIHPRLSASTADLADVDGDGDEDLLVAGYLPDGDTRVTLLPGGPAGLSGAATWMRQASRAQGHPTARFVDADGDGDPDLVVRHVAGGFDRGHTSLEVWENQGGTFNRASTGAWFSGGSSAPRGGLYGPVDVTGDGVADLVVGPDRLFAGGAGDVSALVSDPTALGDVLGAEVYVLGVIDDLDGDGDGELFADVDGVSRLIFGGTPVTAGPIIPVPDIISPMPLGDTDGDGATEVFFGGFSRVMAWTGSEFVEARYENLPSPSFLADVDGDGDLDPWSSNQLHRWIGDDDDLDGDGTPYGQDCNDFDATTHPGAEEPVGAEFDQDCDGVVRCWIDRDNDGYGSSNTRTATHCQAEGVAPLSGDCADNDVRRNPGAEEGVGDGQDQDCDGLELCRADQDGDGDFASAPEPSEDLTCRAPGLARAIAATASMPLPTGAWGAGDVDGDGRLDLVVGYPSLDGHCDAIDTGRGFIPGDSAEPGVPDPVCTSGAGAGALRIWLARSGTPGETPDLEVPGFANGARLGTVFDADGDVNGDGIHDIAALHAETLVILAGRAGEAPRALGEPVRPQQLSSVLTRVTHLGDLDGDGYGEVGVNGIGSPRSSYWVYQGGPGGLRPEPSWSTTFSGPPHAPLVGDFDGDGLGDFVFSPQGTPRIWRGRPGRMPAAAGEVVPIDFRTDINRPSVLQLPDGPPEILTAGGRWRWMGDQGFVALSAPPLGDALTGVLHAFGSSLVLRDRPSFSGTDAYLTGPGGRLTAAGGANACSAEAGLITDLPGAEILLTCNFTTSVLNFFSATDLIADCDDDDPERAFFHPEGVADGRDSDCHPGELCAGDEDGDGYGGATTIFSEDLDCRDSGEHLPDDCDDADPLRSPGAPEIADDGVDQNCDGRELCFVDADADGFRPERPAVPIDGLDCAIPGFAPFDAPSGDCADYDPQIHPGAREFAVDGVDQDCDGHDACFRDGDGDGFGGEAVAESEDATCRSPGVSPRADDCDDGRADVHPGATETPGDLVDADCDGRERCFADRDGDGATSTRATLAPPDCAGASVTPGDDCDDTDAARAPGRPERPGDGLDADCDGFDLCFFDSDGDGEPAPSPDPALPGCTGAAAGQDCDDADPARHPGALEAAGDGIDSDCDGTELCFLDTDGDGHASITASPGPVDCPNLGPGDDCDDDAPGRHPGAPELPGAGVDRDCDGRFSCYEDADQDGAAGPVVVAADDPTCTAAALSFGPPTDCDDADPSRAPGAPELRADGVDQDCDGLERCPVDHDGDGAFGRQSVPGPLNCPDGPFDCDDNDAGRAPQRVEVADDGVDQDCNGQDLVTVAGCRIGGGHPSIWLVAALAAATRRHRDRRAPTA
jgi:hypothetical protein